MKIDNPFTIDNLPYGVFSSKDVPQPRCTIAYENHVIKNLSAICSTSHFQDFQSTADIDVFKASSWNAFALLHTDVRRKFRVALKAYLSEQNLDDREKFIPTSEVELHFPMETKNYSDFYCSYEHAKNCSDVFNLQISPNWYFLPQVYNGRTSSLAVSGTPVTRPKGIFPLSPGAPPTFQAENKFDFELEMGIWIAGDVPRGKRLDINNAKEHIFGITLLNDWSARSIQFAEMQPLGPFHSKGSLTSVSPWIVPYEALEETASCSRHQEQDPKPLPHLSWSDSARATWDINVQVSVIRDGKEYVFSQSNLNELHWTPLQQVTHLASAGEGITAGDVFGTGTISSSRTNDKGEKIGLSCIWERQLASAKLSSLPSDINDTLLKDDDEVVMTAWCLDASSGKVKFGFGECRGKVLPAV